MKKVLVKIISTPWFPIVFCIGLVLSIVVSSKNTPVVFSSWDLCWMFFILLGIIVTLWWVVFLVLKSGSWSGIFSVLSVLLVCVLLKGSAVLVFTLLVSALVTLVWGKKINWTGCTIGANLVALVLVVVLGISVYRVSLIPTTSYKSISDLPQGVTGTLPDIYLLILDTYPSIKETQDQFGVNNHVFVDELRSRSLKVTENYTTSYLLTMFSMTSILNMNYPITYPDPEFLFGKSEVLNTLDSLGYTSILLGSGWYPTAYSKYFDYNLQVRYSGLEGFKQLVLFRGRGVYGTEVSFRKSVPYQFDELDKVGSRPESTFVFAHMQGLHPPMCFGPDGLSPKSGLSKSELFAGQLDYVNTRVLEFLDSVDNLNSSIVIITSDHGSFLEDSPLIDSCVPNLSDPEWIHFIVSRLVGFQAIYIPGCSDLSTLDLIQPNVFRTIFRQYFNISYPNLESKNYFVKERCVGTSMEAFEVTNLLEVK